MSLSKEWEGLLSLDVPAHRVGSRPRRTDTSHSWRGLGGEEKLGVGGESPEVTPTPRLACKEPHVDGEPEPQSGKGLSVLLHEDRAGDASVPDHFSFLVPPWTFKDLATSSPKLYLENYTEQELAVHFAPRRRRERLQKPHRRSWTRGTAPLMTSGVSAPVWPDPAAQGMPPTWSPSNALLVGSLTQAPSITLKREDKAGGGLQSP